MSWHATSSSDRKLLVNRFAVWDLGKRVMVSVAACEQEEAPAARGWSRVNITFHCHWKTRELSVFSLIVTVLNAVEQSGHLIKVATILLCLSTETFRVCLDYIAFNQPGAEATSCCLTSHLYPWLYQLYWHRSSNSRSMHTPGPLHSLIHAGPLSRKSDWINVLSLN